GIVPAHAGRPQGSPLHALKHLILAKTQGNPFFMEEIVQELREQGVLPSVGATHASPLPIDLHIPPTVQGILAARIDRLTPDEKALLQQLSVIGRQFPLSLIRQVIAQPEADLYRLLASLQHKEFLYEQPAFPESEYIFKHALTQEVAYGTVLQEQRKLLHERTGQALETVYAALLPEHYNDLAHHYRRSPNTEKAIEYLHLAGQQAVQRSAHTEAISHLTAALDLLMTRPETPERAAQELTLRLAVGPPLIAAQGATAPAVEQNYLQARALCDQLGDSPQRSPVLWGLFAFYLNRGELRTAQALVDECLQLAEQTHDDGLLLQAHRAAGTTALSRGEFIRARESLEQSVELYLPQHQVLIPLYGGNNPKVQSLTVTVPVLWCLGYPERALTQLHEVLHLAQELGHSYSLVQALGFAACWLHLERGDGRIAQERANAAVALCSEYGFPLYLAMGTVLRGQALIVQEQWAEGIAQVRQGLEAYAGAFFKTGYLAWLARGYEGAGQTEEGLATIAEALRLVDKTDERYYEAELYRIKGELTLQKSKASPGQVEDKSQTSRSPSEVEKEAEECFVKAIEVAQKQQAKSLELRAVMSLVRLRQQQAAQAESRVTDDGSRSTDHASRTKLDEARTMLSEVYNWFTEGFDTKDLQEAKMLIEELSHRAIGPLKNRTRRKNMLKKAPERKAQDTTKTKK
ncbi:MAG: hypothetical protein AB7G75_31945, partial [Candidatus Binatia bacterium]